MQHLDMRYGHQLHARSLRYLSTNKAIKIMDIWHATLRFHQEYFSQTGRFEGDIMKGYFQLNKLPPQYGLKPGTARSTGQC